MRSDYELVIIGGGPAGLSAALAAARARRSVLVIDGGTPRNAAAPALHTFVTRDGILPPEFRRIAREQIANYPTVAFAEGVVQEIVGEVGSFRIMLGDEQHVTAARVLLATGLVDILPEIPGVREHWGRGVHHCPYCDGYEHADRTWGILADRTEMLEHLSFFSAWTRDIVVFTHGERVPEELSVTFARAGFRVVTDPIARVVGGTPGRMDHVELVGGERVSIESLWIRPLQRLSDVARRLALPVREDGAVERDETGETSIRGIFVAGDLAAGPVQQALLAAADGARVAYAINRQLVLEQLFVPGP